MVFFSPKFESMLFAVCKGEDGRASIRAFLEEIERTGIRARTDPRYVWFTHQNVYTKSLFVQIRNLNSRLVTVVQKLEKYKPRPGASLESIT